MSCRHEMAVVEAVRRRLGGTEESADDDRELVWGEIAALEEEMQRLPPGEERVAKRRVMAALNMLMIGLNPHAAAEEGEGDGEGGPDKGEVGRSPWQLDKPYAKRFLEDFVYRPASEQHEWMLRIEQAAADVPEALGRTVWDGALVLARYLEDRAASLPLADPSAKLVEIGAGCGLAGMVAARLTGRPAQVLLTDLPHVIDQLAFNCATNGLICPVLPLDWSQPHPPDVAALGPFDVVLGADVLYMHVDCAQLIATIDRLLVPGPSGLVLLACERHDDRSHANFRKALTSDCAWQMTIADPESLSLIKPTIDFMVIRRNV